MEENKRITIQIRLDKELKDRFQAICKQKAVNGSELIRQLIEQWTNEQENTTLQHNRINDIK